MAQSINNVGSQQALESNWNDENAMRKFERATEGAARERKDEIQLNKLKPNSVELRANSGSVEQQPVIVKPEPEQSTVKAPPSRRTGMIQIPERADASGQTSGYPARYLAAGLFLFALLLVGGYISMS
ncbi:MAG: hypothetical protein ACRECY_17970 [Phyllobacterium sp.]